MQYLLKIEDEELLRAHLGAIHDYDPKANIFEKTEKSELGLALITSSEDAAALAKMFGCSNHPLSLHVAEQAKKKGLSIGELIARDYK